MAVRSVLLHSQLTIYVLSWTEHRAHEEKEIDKNISLLYMVCYEYIAR